MSMPGYRDRLKSDIIKVSREILATEGLEGIQARKVATASNCSVGTIYNLFGSLDMVIIAANTETLSQLKEELISTRAGGHSFNEHLDALAGTYLGFAMGRTNEWRAMFEHRFPTKTEVPAYYREAQGEVFSIVEEILKPAIETADSRREAARALFSAVHGVVSIALDEKLGEFDEAATKRQVSFIIRSVARGISDGHSNP